MVLLNASGQIPDTELDLRTRANKGIANTQAWQLSTWDWKAFAEIIKKFGNAKKVADACPVYNCHGLTFASRRTAVDAQVFPILADDGFEEVPAKDAQEGDVIVYFDERGEVSHTGFVIGHKEVILGNGLTIPKIWSKWGKGPEMVHLVPECDFYIGDDSIKFYRLTKWKEGWLSI